MKSPLNNFDQKLVTLKQSIDELKYMLEEVKTDRNVLKVHVDKDNELKLKSKELKREIAKAENQLKIILDFVKEVSGEESYALFPLFAQENKDIQIAN